MKILYRYLYTKLFIYILIILPAFSFIVLLAELIEILRKIQNADLNSIALYMLYKLPEKIYFILPVVVVIAFMILVKELIDKKEIYPILLNGISLKQLGINLFLFPFFLSILQVINLEFIMPPFKEKSEELYQKLKVGSVEEDKYLIAYDRWVAVGENKFIYFGFLDLNKKKGNNIVYVEFNKDFKPIQRVEGNEFFINNSQIVIKDAKIIDFSKIDKRKIEITNYSKYYVNLNVGLKNLKKIFKVRKPVSLTEFYKTAKVFEKFGYSASYYWSRFYSTLSTVFSPLILTIAIYPFLWNRRKDSIILAFVSIIAYWYGISFITSLSESGAIPYLSVFIVDIIFVLVGLIKLKNLTFTEV